jgi:hypothetical protein
MKGKVRKVKVKVAGLQGVPMETAESIVDQTGIVQDQMDSMISAAINPVFETVNKLAAPVMAGEKLLETDRYQSLTELFTETFYLLGGVLRSANSAVQSLVGLDPKVQKDLIKLSNKGDEVCDKVGGMKLMFHMPNLVYPWGMTRAFDACLEAKTAERVIQKMTTKPLEPMLSFVDCALSENVLKPIDHGVVDIKNAIATGIKAGLNLGDVLGNVKNGAQMVVDSLEKGVAGSYVITPNPDTFSCFQSRMNDVEYNTVGIDRILKDIVDMQFIGGKKIESTPFSRKPARRTCKL